MKKLLLGIFIANSFFVSAQNFVYTPSKHVGGTIQGKVNEYLIGLRTPNPEEITYKWERVSNTFPADWDYSICDHNHCYIGLPATGTMHTISLSDAEAGTNGYFKVTILSADTDGKGVITLYVYDSNDKTRGDTLTFSVTKGVSSISAIANNSLKAYPNPANSSVNITTYAANSQLSIHNVLGERVYSKTLEGAGKHTINLTELSTGTYYLRLANEGVIRQTRIQIAR